MTIMLLKGDSSRAIENPIKTRTASICQSIADRKRSDVDYSRAIGFVNALLIRFEEAMSGYVPEEICAK